MIVHNSCINNIEISNSNRNGFNKLILKSEKKSIDIDCRYSCSKGHIKKADEKINNLKHFIPMPKATY